MIRCGGAERRLAMKLTILPVRCVCSVVPVRDEGGDLGKDASVEGDLEPRIVRMYGASQTEDDARRCK